MEVWIDARHLVRQIRFQAPVPAAATGGRSSGKAAAAIIFTGFGAPVHVTPPPASQTADITSELSRQRAQASSGWPPPGGGQAHDHCRLAHMSNRPEASSPGGRPGPGFHS